MWTYLKALNKKPPLQHLLASVPIRYFVGEAVKLFFNKEVEVSRAYQGIVCSIRLIGSRVLAEAQFSCLGGIFVVGNLRLEANAGEPG